MVYGHNQGEYLGCKPERWLSSVPRACVHQLLRRECAIVSSNTGLCHRRLWGAAGFGGRCARGTRSPALPGTDHADRVSPQMQLWLKHLAEKPTAEVRSQQVTK